MHDVNHALANLRDLSGIETLEFNSDGALTLVFDERTEINFIRIDDQTVEIWTEIENLSDGNDVSLLRSLLIMNYLGEETGSARIALGGGSFVLCERIAVEPLSGIQFANRILDFLKYATFWKSDEGARALLAKPDALSDITDGSMLQV